MKSAALAILIGVAWAGWPEEIRFAPVGPGACRSFETRMKTSDGAELYTYGVVPTNGVKCPIIVMRTPYDGHKLDGGPEKWARGQVETVRRGYARVVQQCRGTARSGGVRIPYVDERRDSLAMLAFLRTLPCYDGSLFLSGGSYLSSVHWAYLNACPPDVKGAVLDVQCADRYPVVMHNGFVKIGLNLVWYLGQYKSNMDGVPRHRNVAMTMIPFCEFTKSFFGDAEGPLPGIDDVILHPRPEDPFWKTPGGAGGDYRNAFTHSRIPILMRTGWFDIYADAMCDQWREASDERKANCAMVIDALDHSGRRYGEATNATSVVHFPNGGRNDAGVRVPDVDWFDYVRGGSLPASLMLGGVCWYGLWENKWHRTKTVPCGKRRLTFPLKGVPVRSFRYDPRKPVQFPRGCGIGFGHISPMPKADFRSDVITYILDPIESVVDIAGKMEVSLRVTSDCEDTAFYVRVSIRKAGTEVFWGLRESIKALTWDEGEYMPGTARTLRFSLADLACRLEKGDVLRLDVSSSNASMFVPHANVKGLQAFAREPKVARNAVLTEGSSVTVKALD